jgi:cytochrome P450
MLPKDADIMVVVAPLSEREATLAHAETEFDGFRHVRPSVESAAKTNRSFATTSLNNMHFGHGRYACPGRFLASDMIKMILGHWLLSYDMEFVGGGGRPASTTWHEVMFPDMKQKVRFSKRK